MSENKVLFSLNKEAPLEKSANHYDAFLTYSKGHRVVINNEGFESNIDNNINNSPLAGSEIIVDGAFIKIWKKI